MGERYRGVLFDLFGTLVDFRSTFTETLDRILVDHDLLDKAPTFVERFQTFVFQGVEGGTFITVHEDFERALEHVLTDLGVEGDLKGYSQGVISEMFEKLRTAEIFPEVPEVVGRLDRLGVGWAIVSNVDEGDLEYLLDHHGLRPAVTVSSERARSYKPNAGPFIRALEDMGLATDEALHVGDSPIADIMGAASHGLDTVWVNRYREPYPEDMTRPRWEVEDLRPVPGLASGGEAD